VRGYLAICLSLLMTIGCSSEPTAPSPIAPASGYTGRWSGTVLVIPIMAPGSGIPTIQSQLFSFTVSADQRVTDINIG
jgi:hypothetical protein